MKITWFAAMTFRIQIAGRIVVTAPEGAPEGIDAAELVSGAQRVVAGANDVAAFDPALWRPRRRGRLIDDEDETEAASLFRFGTKGLVADSVDEGVLVIAGAGEGLHWARWADNAVVILSGTGKAGIDSGLALLEVARPKLIALAVTDGEIDQAFDALAPRLGDASLIVLEPGLAVEV